VTDGSSPWWRLAGDGERAARLPASSERVVVAMSGGVDSSVAAALLHERGCEVVGVTLTLWEDPDPCAPDGGCCTPDDILDARRVCAQIGVPHYLLDWREAFREAVVEPFVRAYARGETPNPCVRCNQVLKFDRLLRRVAELDARWLATGHYARIVGEPGLALLRARDPGRDQSYFLHGIRADVLPRLSFPLGGLSKSEVRAHARRLGLRTRDKPDSQDVCFVAGGRAADFVARMGGARPRGDVVDASGRSLGRHEGVHAYTVGQRRGLGIASRTPLYVIEVDAATDRLVVGPEEALDACLLEATEWSWLRHPRAGEPLKARARSRSRDVEVVTIDESPMVAGISVHLRSPLRAASPGQSLVLYGGERGEELLGGGVLSRPPRPVAESLGDTPRA
jgi:tRNA-specific 2-thiouridylase